MDTSGHLLKRFNRGFIFVRGVDALALLQGLLTCDVSKSHYGFLLTPNGRFLSDVFINPYKDGYMLDVYDKPTFLKTLKMYKLNRQVEIEDVEGDVGWTLEKNDHDFCYKDPRFYGYRFLSKKPIENYETYHFHRVKSGISDPPWELIPLKSIVLEHNIPDDAINYDKGCYIGQELIARTHYQGVVRKKIIVCEVEKGQVAYGDELENQEGKVYSVSQNLCLVMIRENAFGKKTFMTDMKCAILSRVSVNQK